MRGRDVHVSALAWSVWMLLVQGNQNVGYRLATTLMTQPDALSYCESLGLGVVVPRNQAETDVIRALLPPGDVKAWVGITFIPGVWLPVLTWTNWNAGEGISTDKVSGMVWQSSPFWNGEWYDFVDDGRTHYAICGSAGSYISGGLRTHTAAVAYCDSQSKPLAVPQSTSETTDIRAAIPEAGDVRAWLGIYKTNGFWHPQPPWPNWGGGEGAGGSEVPTVLTPHAQMKWASGWNGQWEDHVDDSRTSYVVCSVSQVNRTTTTSTNTTSTLPTTTTTTTNTTATTTTTTTNTTTAANSTTAVATATTTKNSKAANSTTTSITTTTTTTTNSSGITTSTTTNTTTTKTQAGSTTTNTTVMAASTSTTNRTSSTITSSTSTNQTTTGITSTTSTNQTTTSITSTTSTNQTTTTTASTTSTNQTTTTTASTTNVIGAILEDRDGYVFVVFQIDATVTDVVVFQYREKGTPTWSDFDPDAEFVGGIWISAGWNTNSTDYDVRALVNGISIGITDPTTALAAGDLRAALSITTTRMATVTSNTTVVITGSTSTPMITTHTATVATTTAVVVTGVCNDLPTITSPASLEANCAGRSDGEICNIICPHELGNNYTNVGQPYFTCSNGNFERPAAALCEANACDYAPKAMFGAVHGECQNLADGASCVMRCNEGYGVLPGHISFLCAAGTWKVSSACILNGAQASQQVPLAVAMDVAIRSAAGSDFHYEWARNNGGAITAAVINALNKSQNHPVHIDISGSSSGRRLQNADGFDVFIISAVDNSSNLSKADLANNTLTKLLGGFMQALRAELEANGDSIPHDLLGATISQGSQPAQVLENFTFAVAEWVPGAWGTCSNSCGDGTRTRDVVCSAGASLCTQAMPSSSEYCENYDGCPFDMVCPLGRGADMGCGAQLVLLIGTISLPFFCSLFCCAFRSCKEKMYPSMNGNRMLKLQGESGVKEKVFFRILCPERNRLTDIVTKRTTTATRSSKASNKSRNSGISFWSRTHVEERIDDDELTLGTAEDGRIHVVWDIDQPRVETWFEKTRSFLRIKSASKSGSSLHLGQYDTKPEDTGTFRLSIVDPLLFVNAGTRAEYFSLTHLMWIPATVMVDIIASDEAKDDQVVMYHAMIGHGFDQRRHNVGQDCLRLPFDIGDKVEVFSQKDDGIWLAAEVFGEQPPLTTVMGYQVLFTDTQAIGHMIPATRIRLRYPPGQTVFVYKGWNHGWINGVVDASAPPNGIGARGVWAEGAGVKVARTSEREKINLSSKNLLVTPRRKKAHSPHTPREDLLPRIPSRLHSHDRIQSRDGSRTPKLSPRTHSRNTLQSCREVHPWVEVPVICEGSSDVELIPSYLLRHNAMSTLV